MKIRVFHTEDDKEKNLTIWIPTGFLFSRVGMYILSRMVSGKARKDYDKAVEELWKSGGDAALDDLVTLEDVQAAERLTPPITQEQARELFTALRDSKYLLKGLPLVSIDDPDGVRLRIDL